MPTHLDMLPDELYQMIYRPLLDAVINECVRRRRLDLRHRSFNEYHTLDAYDPLFKRSRSNYAAIYAWLIGRKKRANRLWTDGDKLYSYDMVIGFTQNNEKVVRQRTAKNGYFVSVTTSMHCNMASQFADVVHTALEDIS
eukprot:COSAG04_NODE_3724_length_2581_cov_76.628928_4_plen_140_part_00